MNCYHTKNLVHSPLESLSIFPSQNAAKCDMVVASASGSRPPPSPTSPPSPLPALLFLWRRSPACCDTRTQTHSHSLARSTHRSPSPATIGSTGPSSFINTLSQRQGVPGRTACVLRCVRVRTAALQGGMRAGRCGGAQPHASSPLPSYRSRKASRPPPRSI